MYTCITKHARLNTTLGSKVTSAGHRENVHKSTYKILTQSKKHHIRIIIFLYIIIIIIIVIIIIVIIIIVIIIIK